MNILSLFVVILLLLRLLLVLLLMLSMSMYLYYCNVLSIQYDYFGLLLPITKLSAAVGLSNLLKSKLVRPDELDNGLGNVFGRIFGETGFCSCTIKHLQWKKRQKEMEMMSLRSI